MSNEDKDWLSLKWGTLKGWQVRSEPFRAALQRYVDFGMSSGGAMTQHDTPEQRQALCDAIDAMNAETVYLDWDDRTVTKAEAKQYVMEYGA